MKETYCPKCHKAGLKYHSNWDDPKFGTYHFEDGIPIDDIRGIVAPGGYGTAKWCPRCKEWVKPVNHPYIGSKLK